MVRGGGENADIVGVVDDEVGIAANGYGTLARVEAKELRRFGAGCVHEAMDVEAAAFDAEGVEEIDALFEAGDAVGDLVKSPSPMILFHIERAVVGADGVDVAFCEAFPKHTIVAFVAEGRRHHVLHPLHAGAFGISFVEDEVRDDGFDRQVDTAPLRADGSVERAFAGEVDDVAVGSGVFKEGAKAGGAFHFHGFGAAGFMPFGTGLALGEQALLEATDKLRVFAVGGDDDTELFRQHQGLVHFAIVDTEEILVGEEDFERTDAVCDDFPKLAFRIGCPVGDGHVEGVVAGAVAFSFGLPELVAFQRVVQARRAAHFDEGSGATDERGDAGGFMRVLREGGHEGQVDVDVGVDEAGEDELAGGVDDFCVRRSFEVGTDAGYGFVFDVDVTASAGVGVDDVGVADEEWHVDG